MGGFSTTQEAASGGGEWGDGLIWRALRDVLLHSLWQGRLHAQQTRQRTQGINTSAAVGSPIRPMGVTSKNETGACRRLESMRLCIFQLALSPIS